MVKTQLWGETNYTVCILAPKTALKWKVKKISEGNKQHSDWGKSYYKLLCFTALSKILHVLCMKPWVFMPKLRHGNLSHTH